MPHISGHRLSPREQLDKFLAPPAPTSTPQQQLDRFIGSATSTPSPPVSSGRIPSRLKKGLVDAAIQAFPGIGDPRESLKGLNFFERNVIEPITAAGTVAQAPSALGLAGVPGFQGDFAFNPEQLPGREGFREEFRRNVPLGSRILAEAAFDPLNLAPGVGFTKLPAKGLRAGQAARKVSPSAAKSIPLTEGPIVRQLSPEAIPPSLVRGGPGTPVLRPLTPEQIPPSLRRVSTAPKTVPKADRGTYQEIQNAIDSVEDGLERQGRNVIRMVHPSSPGAETLLNANPPWEAMPDDLHRLYQSRDGIAASENASEITQTLSKVSQESLAGPAFTVKESTIQTFLKSHQVRRNLEQSMGTGRPLNPQDVATIRRGLYETILKDASPDFAFLRNFSFSDALDEAKGLRLFGKNPKPVIDQVDSILRDIIRTGDTGVPPGSIAPRASAAPSQVADTGLRPDFPQQLSSDIDLPRGFPRVGQSAALLESNRQLMRAARARTRAAESFVRSGVDPREAEQIIAREAEELRSGLAAANRIERQQIERIGPKVAEIDTPSFDAQLSRAAQGSELTLTPPQVKSADAPGLLQLAKAPFAEALDDIRGALKARPPAPRDVIQRVNQMTVNDWLQVGGQAGVEVLNTLKTVWSSIDISYLLRQGGILTAGHPRTAGRLLGQSIRAIMDPSEFRRYDEFIRNDPDFVRLATQRTKDNPNGAGTPVKLLESGGDLAKRDEAYVSSLLQRVPVLGIPFRASERGFHTFLNGLRFRVAKQEINSAVARGNIIDDSLIDGMNNLVNKTTGIGSFGPADKLAPFANIPFWSPRLLMSRPQTLLLLMEKNPAVRKLIAKDLAAFMSLGFLTMGLTAYGVKNSSIEFDRRSSDFAKLKVGPQRFDPWAGFQPLVRYLSQFIEGERKTTSTGQIQSVPRIRPGERKARSRRTGRMFTIEEDITDTTAFRFTRSKLSPAAGTIVDLVLGEDFVGQESPDPSLRREAFQRLSPLIARDIEEAFQEAGITGAVSGGIGAGVGVGTSAFGGEGARPGR